MDEDGREEREEGVDREEGNLWLLSKMNKKMMNRKRKKMVACDHDIRREIRMCPHIAEGMDEQNSSPNPS